MGGEEGRGGEGREGEEKERGYLILPLGELLSFHCGGVSESKDTITTVLFELHSQIKDR